MARALGVQRQSVSLWEAGGSISPLSLSALRDLFGPELGPQDVPTAANLAYWQSRVARVEQLAADLLDAQRAIVAEMARQIPPDQDHRVEPEAATTPTPPAPAVRRKGTARG